MGMAVYTWKAGDYPPAAFPPWENRWLGQWVTFQLSGIEFTGEVVETQRHRLCNGVHDILTVEIDDNGSQVKIQAHRQKFRRIDKEASNAS